MILYVFICFYMVYMERAAMNATLSCTLCHWFYMFLHSFRMVYMVSCDFQYFLYSFVLFYMFLYVLLYQEQMTTLFYAKSLGIRVQGSGLGRGQHHALMVPGIGRGQHHDT
jgi:hypothetical protein